MFRRLYPANIPMICVIYVIIISFCRSLPGHIQ